MNIDGLNIYIYIKRENYLPTNFAKVLSAEDNTELKPCFNGSIFLSIFKSLKVLL